VSADRVEQLLRTLRRRVVYAAAVRWFVLVSIVAGVLFAGPLGMGSVGAWASIWLLCVLIGWLILVFVSARTARLIQTASLLIAARRWEAADLQLERALRGATVFKAHLLMAGQQFASLLRGREAHADAVRVLRAVLRMIRSWTRGARPLVTVLRLMLADSELALDNTAGAYAALLPVYGTPLRLSERLLLLPIDLRYALTTGCARHAVTDLRERVRLAELLGSREAAWVHALLAEACAREGLTPQAAFLRRRAALYHDLDDLPTSAGVGAPTFFGGGMLG
jgi:hypothetical protein